MGSSATVSGNCSSGVDTFCRSAADLLVAVFNTSGLALTCHRNEPMAANVVVVIRAWILLRKLVKDDECRTLRGGFVMLATALLQLTGV